MAEAPLSDLQRIAVEMEELARAWRAEDPDSPGPEVLRQWRTRIALALARLNPPPSGA